jgi:hypothetical protein
VIVKHILSALLIATPLAITFAISVAAEDNAASTTPPPGSVTKEEGLEAWKRIEAVVTHPRCANCHVGADNIPMWTVVGETKTRPHGMNIHADDMNILADGSRIGTKGLACSTCHMTSTAPNDVPHAPPHVGLQWRLAPVAFVWFGKSGAEICAQMRDRDRNNNRDAAGLVKHLRDEETKHGFVPWAWNPGGGRTTPPGTFEDHVKDVAMWGAAGLPCSQD